MLAQRAVVTTFAASIAALAIAACGPDEPKAPETEFLLLAGDSTYWVWHEDERLQVRGSPIQLARMGDRLVEIYVADDDRSYRGALLVGQRIYRRDLITGDSAIVFDDTTITSLARWYAREHPRERRLTPDQETDAQPHVDVLGEVVTIDQHGPFLSIEYRVDGTLEGTNELHEVRRAVVDMRDGTPATLAELFGDSAAKRMIAEGARTFSRAVDSVIASTDVRAREALPTLAELSFNAHSFNLAIVAREPAVEFVATGMGPVSGGIVLPLEPIRAPVPAWWEAVLAALPVPSADSMTDRWRRGAFAVEARYDTLGDRATLVVTDTVRAHDWRVGSIPSPAHRLFWIDAPADSLVRQALGRAFDEAALYSEDARTVSRPLAPRRVLEPVRVARISPAGVRQRGASGVRHASFTRQLRIP
jgi:hypothetical protein